MKTFLFAAVFTVAATMAMGQTRTATGSPEARAKQLTQEMTTRYHLDESSYIRLKNANLEHIKRMDEIDRMYNNDAAMHSQKATAAKEVYSKSLQEIMRPAQYQEFTADASAKQ